MVIGGVGTLGCGIQPLSLSFSAYQLGGIPSPADATIPIDRRLLNFTTVAAVLDLVTSAALFVSAYAVLRRWEWGRRAALWVSAAIIVIALGKMIGSLTFVRQAQIDLRLAAVAAMSPEQRQNVPPDHVQQVQRMSYLGPPLLFAIQSLVPILILLIWTRPAPGSSFSRRPS